MRPTLLIDATNFYPPPKRGRSIFVFRTIPHLSPFCESVNCGRSISCFCILCFIHHQSPIMKQNEAAFSLCQFKQSKTMHAAEICSKKQIPILLKKVLFQCLKVNRFTFSSFHTNFSQIPILLKIPAGLNHTKKKEQIVLKRARMTKW